MEIFQNHSEQFCVFLNRASGGTIYAIVLACQTAPLATIAKPIRTVFRMSNMVVIPPLVICPEIRPWEGTPIPDKRGISLAVVGLRGRGPPSRLGGDPSV